MDRLPQLGRFLFAISFAAFGIQYFLYGHYRGGLSPIPSWAPGGAIGAYLIGAFLVVAAISLLTNWNARVFATLLGLVYLLCVLLLHSQHFTAVIYNSNDRSRSNLFRLPAPPLCSPDFRLPLLQPNLIGYQMLS